MHYASGITNRNYGTSYAISLSYAHSQKMSERGIVNTRFMLPDWHRLISAWIAQGGYGLTIPFLVGVRHAQAGTTIGTRIDIENLLGEIIECPVPGFTVYPRWCIDMESVVLTTYPTDFAFKPKYNLVEFKPRSGGPISMAVERDLATRLSVQATQENLIEALTAQALPFVEQGNYSQFWTIEGRQSGPLHGGDLTFINTALGRRRAR